MRISPTLIFLFFSVASLSARPPAVPSAGVVERELEREYEARPLEFFKDVPPIQIDIPEEQLDIPEGMTVFISSVRIQGNECVSAAEFACEVDPYLRQELCLADIYKICAVVEQYYTSRGYFLARAYPPPQDIKDGLLTIEVLEGRLGNIEVVGNCYYSDRFILSYFRALLGQPLQYDQFLMALMLVNDNSDLCVGSIFEKGEEVGCADVILRVSDARPVHLYLNANDYGRELTTNTRVGGRLDYGNLITYGDIFSVAEVVGLPVDALNFTDVSYTVPVNRRGTYVGAAYLFSRFKIEELRNLHLRGKSDIATLRVDQAFIRERHLSVDLFSYFDYKQIQNFALGQRTSFDKLRVLTVGGYLDHLDPSCAHDFLTVSFAAGLPNLLDGLKSVDDESSRLGAGGRFFIFNVDYDRLQLLPRDTYFYFHASGQVTGNKLTLPEQIYIGGSDTVRGYPLAVALGDSGYYLNFEYRFPPPGLGNRPFFNTCKQWKDVIQFDVFFDHGGVFLRSIQDTFLCGTGVGVTVQGPYCLTLSVDVGFPLNHRDLTRGAFTYFKLASQPF